VNNTNNKKFKKKNRYSNNKKFSLLGKSSGLIPLVSNPGIGAWYSGLCRVGCFPSCQTAWGGEGCFFGLMVHLLQAEAPKCSQQMTGL
jgi:hypothetical protein